MSFKSLYKLFVMNDIDTFQSIYNQKFNSTSSIKFDIYINENHSLMKLNIRIK